jgi:glutathione S-transferase
MTLELYHHGYSACAAKVPFALAEKRWLPRVADWFARVRARPTFGS